ncbi:MAG: ornithine cyclodeaminase [Pseudomonadota bacterium]
MLETLSHKGRVIPHVPHIGFAEIDAQLSWKGVADALLDGHRGHRAVHDDLWLEHESKGFFNRCALIPGLGLATKSVTVFPQNRDASPPRPAIQGAVCLFDDQSGELLAILDGELVTKWKTTGDSILGARLLARPDSKHLLIVGAGTVGGHAIDAYCELFPTLETINIWNRSADGADALVHSNQHRCPRVARVLDLAEAVGKADIVACATMSPDPIISGAWANPGCHFDLVGAFLPHMREADNDLLLASKIYVDSRKSTFHDIGELAIPLSEGVITKQDVLGDYYDLCHTSIPRHADDITLLKNGGGGHLDLMCAHYIYTAYLQSHS